MRHISNRFLIPYVEMFIRLEAIGCSFKNLEKSLSTYSLNGFNDNLAKLHPELSYNISLIIADYD